MATETTTLTPTATTVMATAIVTAMATGTVTPATANKCKQYNRAYYLFKRKFIRPLFSAMSTAIAKEPTMEMALATATETVTVAEMKTAMATASEMLPATA